VKFGCSGSCWSILFSCGLEVQFSKNWLEMTRKIGPSLTSGLARTNFNTHIYELNLTFEANKPNIPS